MNSFLEAVPSWSVSMTAIHCLAPDKSPEAFWLEAVGMPRIVPSSKPAPIVHANLRLVFTKLLHKGKAVVASHLISLQKQITTRHHNPSDAPLSRYCKKD